MRRKLQRCPRRLRVGVFVLVGLFAAAPASAEFVQQGQKLVGPGATGSSRQGSSVALSADGNTALVGGAGDNNGAGAAWVFTRTNGVWTPQGGKLFGSGAVGDAGQGSSVALSADGNTAIIGGPRDNVNVGAAWIFTRTNGAWAPQGDKLVAAGAAENPSLGNAVALSADGNTALIGGPNFGGGAWVFTRSGSTWTQQGDELVGSGSTDRLIGCQGYSVALSADGNTAVVGDYCDNNYAGAAWVFTRNAGAWSQYGNKLTALAGGGLSEYGFSVALSGDGQTILLGGPNNGQTDGTTLVFALYNGAWVHEGLLFGSGNVIDQGQAVALSGNGNVAIVGGFGTAWVFTRQGAWAQQGSKLVGSGASGTAAFGSSVALSSSGNTALIGGSLDNAAIGAAWAFIPPTNTHDFNGNTTSDVVWRDTSGNIAVWLMSGAAAVSLAGLGNLPTSWSIVGQRDFNGDGTADLLWRDAPGDTAIWFMNGAQPASSAALGDIPSNWFVIATGDFNGDGKGDILWRDGGGNLGVWLMNGAAVTASGGLGQVPGTWTVVGAGDFNADGNTDLLWRDDLGNTSIWFMDGTRAGSSASVGNIPTSFSVVGIGDFNGDSFADIVWRDADGNTSIWLMNGAAVLSAGGLGNVPTTWSIVQTGDYNADGMSDLLWRDNLGNTAVWFMNGVTVSSTGAIGNVPASWTVQSLNAE